MHTAYYIVARHREQKAQVLVSQRLRDTIKYFLKNNPSISLRSLCTDHSLNYSQANDFMNERRPASVELITGFINALRLNANYIMLGIGAPFVDKRETNSMVQETEVQYRRKLESTEARVNELMEQLGLKDDIIKNLVRPGAGAGKKVSKKVTKGTGTRTSSTSSKRVSRKK